MVDVGCNIGRLRLSNPTILASGVMGTDRASLVNVVKSGAGAVTVKSITLEPRKGHNNPTMVEVEGGWLNAMGHCNMGLENAKKEFTDLAGVGAPVMASIVSEDAKGFAHLASALQGMGFSAVEAVLSCPHTPGLGLLAGHGTPEATREIAEAVKKASKIPVSIKLSPNTQNLGEVARAAVAGGADIINMGNTHGPGMVIDIDSAKPVLDFKVGGMSGPSVKAITVRCIYDVYEATGGKIPIIGTGGVTTGADAVEFMMAGASAVGVGTAVYYRGLDVFSKITSELIKIMDDKGVKKTKDFVGVAHG